VSELPDVLLQVFRSFRTAEFTTVSGAGDPITWPVAARYEPEAGTFLVTTSIGLPTKALHARRNPKVSLLFSDPTASGMDSPPAVLVQGLARVDDEIASVDGLEDYWRELLERQPASRLYSLPLVRHFADYYYMRLVIRVSPVHITWWENMDFSSRPSVLTETHAG
jgi:general stress protein 26